MRAGFPYYAGTNRCLHSTPPGLWAESGKRFTIGAMGARYSGTHDFLTAARPVVNGCATIALTLATDTEPAKAALKNPQTSK